MNAFFDLMFLYYLMAAIASLKFASALLALPLERRKYAIVGLFGALVIIAIYFDGAVGLLAALGYQVVLYALVFRTKALKIWPLSLLFQIFLSALTLLIFPSATALRSGVVVIKDPLGAWSLLLMPIFYLAIVGVTKMVDSLYRLRSYKTYALIGSGEHRKMISAYFDSGNTLRYRQCPIIFLRDGIYEFGAEERVEGEIAETLSRLYAVKELYRTLVRLKSGSDSYFVYVAVKDDGRSYNGCDALLNLYLGG